MAGYAPEDRYKFYRPNLHKEAPKKELTDEEKLLAASGASDMIATDAPVMIAGTTQTVFVQVPRVCIAVLLNMVQSCVVKY